MNPRPTRSLPGACAMAAAVLAVAVPTARTLSQTQQAEVTAELNASDFDRFGESSAVSGDDMIIGAPFADGPFADCGAAYIFHLSGGVWTRQARLSASDAAFADNFGISVGISGD